MLCILRVSEWREAGCRGGVRRWETAEVGQAKKQRLKVCCKIFATKEKCRNKNEKKNKLNAAGNKF